MLKMKMEFELEYDPISQKLTFIDYRMKGLKNPFKMVYGNIQDAEQIGATVTAWIKLKEKQSAN